MILRRAVLKVENSSHPGPLYGMFFGAGCITQGIQFFHSRVQKLGLSLGPAHLLIFARFLLGLARREDALVAPVSAAIRADRADIAEGDYLLMLISTLDRLILGLRPFWAQGENPLHLTAMRAGFRHLFRALPALAKGRRNRYASPENGYVSLTMDAIAARTAGLGPRGFSFDASLVGIVKPVYPPPPPPIVVGRMRYWYALAARLFRSLMMASLFAWTVPELNIEIPTAMAIPTMITPRMIRRSCC